MDDEQLGAGRLVALGPDGRGPTVIMRAGSAPYEPPDARACGLDLPGDAGMAHCPRQAMMQFGRMARLRARGMAWHGSARWLP
jgi:hypothetical protein